MAVGDTLYTIRDEVPEMIERERTSVLRLRPYTAGAAIAPTAATVSVYDGSNVAVVSGAVATIGGGQATYTLAAQPSTAALAEGWRIEWLYTMPDGVARMHRQDAALVRCRPLPPATEADLYRRESSINPSVTGVIHSGADFADKLAEAWVRIEHRLIEQGRRPWRVIGSSDLREVHILGTLALVFEDFATRLNAAYATKAEVYRNEYAAAWRAVRMAYDQGDDGRSTPSSRVGGMTTVWLG
jgi:hypothetical protein